jgi:hypothetical protein
LNESEQVCDGWMKIKNANTNIYNRVLSF